MLMSNHERVVKDITNPGPLNIDGKELTQLQLKRVDPKHKPFVDEMVRAVRCRLLGKETFGPSTPEEALAWAQAATYLTGRIQGSAEEKPGRPPDMSSTAAAAVRLVLTQILHEDMVRQALTEAALENRCLEDDDMAGIDIKMPASQWNTLSADYQGFLTSAGIKPEDFDKIPVTEKCNMWVEFTKISQAAPGAESHLDMGA